MVKILFIRPNANETKYTLTIENGSDTREYLICADTYLSLNSPVRDTEISERDFLDICFEDECNKAFRKAYELLSFRDKSRYDLRMKLIHCGFSPDASDYAIERCIELGYLDEYRQVERAVEREVNYKLRGPHHIRRALVGKGYSVSDIDRAISNLLKSGEVDFEKSFECLCEKKRAQTEEERNKLKYRFGYKI